jgi:hypothetical protein
LIKLLGAALYGNVAVLSEGDRIIGRKILAASENIIISVARSPDGDVGLAVLVQIREPDVELKKEQLNLTVPFY